MQYGVGIVGYGFIGKVHTWAHKSVPMFYEPAPVRTRLVGVCTTRPESAEKAKEQGGFDIAVTDWRELIARDDIHIIHCCTPNDAHFELLIAALQAGKHIYCDKPLALTVAEAQEVATLAKNTPGVVCRMTFNNRFAPATLRAKELTENGFLGDLFQYRGAYLHAGYIDPKRPRTWRTQMQKSGGGAILDLGVHIYDLLRHLIGAPDKVHAQLATRITERPDALTGEISPVDVDDVAIVQTESAGGVVGIVEASRLATCVQDELRFELHGSRGAISWNLMEPNFLNIYDATVPESAFGGNRGPQKIECVARYPKPYALGATKNPIGWPQLHVHCLHNFLQAVADGDRESGPNFDDGLAAQKFVAACQTSAASREWVSLNTPKNN